MKSESRPNENGPYIRSKKSFVGKRSDVKFKIKLYLYENALVMIPNFLLIIICILQFF